jgi:hypothetical protein
VSEGITGFEEIFVFYVVEEQFVKVEGFVESLFYFLQFLG